MKRFSVMKTQHNLAEVLREVDAGEEVLITRHKKVVARLLPPERESVVSFPDFQRRAAAAWKDGWTGASSDALIDETRGDR